MRIFNNKIKEEFVETYLDINVPALQGDKDYLKDILRNGCTGVKKWDDADHIEWYRDCFLDPNIDDSDLSEFDKQLLKEILQKLPKLLRELRNKEIGL